MFIGVHGWNNLALKCMPRDLNKKWWGYKSYGVQYNYYICLLNPMSYLSFHTVMSLAASFIYFCWNPSRKGSNFISPLKLSFNNNFCFTTCLKTWSPRNRHRWNQSEKDDKGLPVSDCQGGSEGSSGWSDDRRIRQRNWRHKKYGAKIIICSFSLRRVSNVLLWRCFLRKINRRPEQITIHLILHMPRMFSYE